jgi:hypothetical protein
MPSQSDFKDENHEFPVCLFRRVRLEESIEGWFLGQEEFSIDSIERGAMEGDVRLVGFQLLEKFLDKFWGVAGTTNDGDFELD